MINPSIKTDTLASYIKLSHTFILVLIIYECIYK
jgi:hypothetical protein